MTEQLAFAQMIADADAREGAMLDQHRLNVQTWFDRLPHNQKSQLAQWMLRREWDTCVALSAAAGCWSAAFSDSPHEGRCAVTELVYSQQDADSAPFGHVRFPGSNVDVVTYRINSRDLCILLNKDGVCIYRATLIAALDPDLKPTPALVALQDTFIVRDLATGAAIEQREIEARVDVGC